MLSSLHSSAAETLHVAVFLPGLVAPTVTDASRAAATPAHWALSAVSAASSPPPPWRRPPFQQPRDRHQSPLWLHAPPAPVPARDQPQLAAQRPNPTLTRCCLVAEAVPPLEHLICLQGSDSLAAARCSAGVGMRSVAAFGGHPASADRLLVSLPCLCLMLGEAWDGKYGM